MVVVRPESPGDRASVRVVNERAFPTPLEAHIVDAVRDRCADMISLVADVDGRVVGHVLFSPVRIDGVPTFRSPHAPISFGTIRYARHGLRAR